MSNFIVWRHLAPKPCNEEAVLKTLAAVVQHARTDREAVVGIWVWQQVADDSTGVLPWVYGETQHRPFTGELPAIMIQEIYRSEPDYRAFSESAAYVSNVVEFKTLLREPPKEQNLTPATGFSFRPNSPYSTTEDLYVVAARIQYNPGTVPAGVNCWKTVTSFVEQSEKEGTLGYNFVMDAADPSALYSLEVYRDLAAFDVHKIRTGLTIRVFKQVASSFD
ncbi:hypothetical protein Sste5346_005047 [Sporothrix stenoceras]|uniref:ABM domain-containing protein n=1 Tax=Sporothrix stenoceras TaxID=5173 RepID=A0ABR3Z803_9PEZI